MASFDKKLANLEPRSFSPTQTVKPITGCGHGPELHFFQQHFGLDPSKIQGLDTHQGPENRVEDMAGGVAKPVG